MNRLLTLQLSLLMLCMGHILHAQSTNHFPDSQSEIAVHDLPIPVFKMPAQDNKALLLAERAEREKPGRPPKFAVGIPTDIDFASEARITQVNANEVVLELGILSERAKSLNLGFGEFNLPEDATLYIESGSDHFGPLTPADNDAHGEYWTPVIPGDELLISVHLPPAQLPMLALKITAVNHDFAGFAGAMSGSCNLDVVCSLADGWPQVDTNRDIINSVGVISTGGTTFCTGFLINNGRNDCTPLFMTADHCGIDASNAGSLVVYWKFENSTCRQPLTPASGAGGDGTLSIFNSGAVHLASYGPSDFTIVELDDPIDPLAEAYFPGWSIDSDPPTRMIGVHHPNTDEKRISFDDDAGVISSFGGGGAGTHVQVLDWDVGTTEPGSSGSPIFDQNSRVVGQLHGGGAACGNDLSDYYGWTLVSWTGGGTAGTRLMDWLDPDALGMTTLDGKNCAFSVDVSPAFEELCLTATAGTSYDVTVSDNFTAPVTLSMPGLPAGLSATFAPNPVAPGATATLTFTGLGLLSTGLYSLPIEGTDGVENGTATLTLDAFEIVPAAPALSQPFDGATEELLFPLLDWADALHAKTYELQLSTDPGFASTIYNETGLTASEWAGAVLLETTTYFWRVRTVNVCGLSQWSSTFSFTTADFECALDESTDIPYDIDGGPPNINTSNLVISNSGEITDVNVVGLQGTHSWLEDLEFELTSPTGTTVLLIREACGDLDDFNITFDDQATDNPPCPYNDGGTYLPMGSLSDFNGEEMMGTWTLQVRDMASGDGGALDDWGLEICSKLAPDTTASGLGSLLLSKTSIYPNPADQLLYIDLPSTLNGAVDMQLNDSNGRLLLSRKLQAGSTEHLSLGEFPSGVYSLQLSSSTGVYHRKIIIQH